MEPEVWYANPSDCRGLLPDFPGYGRDGHFGDGRRASRQAVQREVERPAKTGEAIIHAVLDPARRCGARYTACRARERHSSQKPLSLMSIHSTAWAAAMAQR